MHEACTPVHVPVNFKRNAIRSVADTLDISSVRISFVKIYRDVYSHTANMHLGISLSLLRNKKQRKGSKSGSDGAGYVTCPWHLPAVRGGCSGEAEPGFDVYLLAVLRHPS